MFTQLEAFHKQRLGLETLTTEKESLLVQLREEQIKNKLLEGQKRELKQELRELKGCFQRCQLITLIVDELAEVSQTSNQRTFESVRNVYFDPAHFQTSDGISI
jgi:hypothetical protein